MLKQIALGLLGSAVVLSAYLVGSKPLEAQGVSSSSTLELKLDEILDRLTERADQVDAALGAHSDRLNRLEEALTAKEEIPEAPTASLCRSILSQYSGQGWFIRGHRGDRAYMVRHLEGHGITDPELHNLTYDELERIHGAIHTKHSSAAQFAEVRVNVGDRQPLQRKQVYYQNCPTGNCPTGRR